MRRARSVTSASSGGGTPPTVPSEGPPPAARSQSPSGPRGRRHRGSALRRALAPARVELVEEVPAPLGLVGLADGPSDTGQARQAAEEPAVRLVAGTHVARAPPAGAPQRVEPAVVPDAKVGIGLGVVPGQIAERRPRVEVPGEGGSDLGHRGPPLIAPDLERGLEPLSGGSRSQGELRLGRTARAGGGGLVGHGAWSHTSPVGSPGDDAAARRPAPRLHVL